MFFNFVNLLALTSPIYGDVYDYSNPNVFSNVKFPMTYEKINLIMNILMFILIL